MRNNFLSLFSFISFVPFFFAALTVFVFAAETKPIEVLTANVRLATVDDGENHWLKRRDAMMDIIKSRKYDFIGTQELVIHPKDDVNQYKFMCEKLPEYGSVFRSREQDTRLGEGTGVFYRKDRWQPDDTEQGVYWLSDTPSVPGSKTWKDQGNIRIVTGGLFYEKGDDGKLTGKSVYFYSTHFDHKSEIARQKAANLVMRRIAERKSENVPVILVGDFNTGENTPSIRFLRGETVELDGEERKPPLGLVDTFRAVHPDATDVGTYQGFKQPKPNGAKIDFVFTTPDLKTTDAEIIRTKTPSGHYPSDHFFVRATLSLPLGAPTGVAY
ncbi:MAG: endonuclease/exonuclease/phosphatase family protein [Planctomycetaceae bacterium]|jgi:endonuclease/exonuclease/phosphatase family metal-dependent hydrolase|nr:endonuclease/exonuclease/phosphatase family protein [Planctomycetaceae bacterium]